MIPNLNNKRRGPWLQIVVHLIGWLPLAKLIVDFAANNLTVNPYLEITQRLGRIALYFLVASLAVTPTYTLTGWQEILPRRRALGMYAFLYASIHFLSYAGLDYQFKLATLIPLFTHKAFLIVGSLAFSFLIPLAATSFDAVIRRLGRNWKRLHWLVYPAGLLVVIHYGLALKGNLFALRGNILQPLLWGLTLVLLFLLRLSPIRRWVSETRHEVAASARRYLQAKKTGTG